MNANSAQSLISLRVTFEACFKTLVKRRWCQKLTAAVESLPKPGHHVVMCAFLVVYPNLEYSVRVEKNGVLVEREVVANLFLEGGLVKVLPRAKISC